MNKYVTKASDLFFKLKSYWNKPPKGYYVSYKEFVNLSLGFGILSFLSVMSTMATFDVTKDMMYFFNISSGQAWFFGIILAIITILRAPFFSMIIDNCKSKHGKFKPFILPTTILTAVVYCFIPFIPMSWNEDVLFSFKIPALTFLNLPEATDINVSLATLVLWILIILGTSFQALLTQALTGIEQTITPVSQERSNISAFRGLICNIPSSVVNFLPPMLLMFGAFEKVSINDKTAIYPLTLQKYLFPICSILAIVFVYFVVKGTKERIIVAEKEKNSVKFGFAIKTLTKNKYFWIVTLYMILFGQRALTNIVEWVRQFCFTIDDPSAGLADLFNKTLLMNALVVGMVLGPLHVKKWGKRKVLTASSIVFLTGAVLQLMFYKEPWIILIATFVQNLSMGYDFIVIPMAADALDLEQYKTGKRLEGFWQNYHTMILTFVGIFTAVIGPIILQQAGIGFNDNTANKLTEQSIREKVFLYRTITGVVFGILIIIPPLFYDLDERSHKHIIKALTIRAVVESYKEGTLRDSQIVALYDIVEENKLKNNKFIQNELEKYQDIDKILEMYPTAKANQDALTEKEKKEDFERDVEFEYKKLENKKLKALKKNKNLDIDKFISDFIYNSKHLIKLEENSSVYEKKMIDNAMKDKELSERSLEQEKINLEKKLSKKNDTDAQELKTKFILKSKYLIELEEYKDIKELKVQLDKEKEIEKEEREQEREDKAIKKSLKIQRKLSI